MITKARASKVASPAIAATPAPLPKTKQALVVDMLQSKEGATLAALTEATGWLPHSTRSALTGLRKKGHVIVGSRVSGVRIFRILKTSDHG